MSMLDRAIELAARAHAGQTDKAGQPYILHPLRVMLAVGNDPVLQTIAVLHDVVEDTDCDLACIRDALGILPYDWSRIIEAISVLTHDKGQSNVDYWEQVKANPDAMAVKLADIADNMDESRLMCLDRETAMRLRSKYRAALAALTDMAAPSVDDGLTAVYGCAFDVV